MISLIILLYWQGVISILLSKLVMQETISIFSVSLTCSAIIFQTKSITGGGDYSCNLQLGTSLRYNLQQTFPIQNDITFILL